MLKTEDLTNALGKPGKFQIILYIMLGLNYTYVCWSHLGMAFLGAKTKHHCRVNNASDIDKLIPILTKNGVKQRDPCHMYTGYNQTDKISCPNGWTYELEDRENTIIAEWDLVCDDAYKSSLATTVYFLGVILGSLLFGPISDKFGRRPVILLTMYSPVLVGLALFFSRYYIAFIILRSLLGCILQGLQMVSFVAFVEVFAMKYRATVGVLVAIYWSIGVMLLSLIAFIIKDWKYIQLVTICACLLQVGLICFLPESFRWLLTQQRVDEAEQVVKRIAQFNHKPFPREIFDKVAEQCLEMDIKKLKPEKSYTAIDLFKSHVLRNRSAAIALVWFSTSLCYYGLALNVSTLAGNKYFNFFLSGPFEIVICLISAYALNRFGRRKPLCLYSIVGGVICIMAGGLSKVNASVHLQRFVTSLAVIGRVIVSGNFSILFIYTSELYPTVIRNVGLGAGICWARIGSITAPQILLLGKYTNDAVPFIIFGVLVLVSGVLSLFLPETLNMRLAETMEDAGKMYESKTIVDDTDELVKLKEVQKLDIL